MKKKLFGGIVALITALVNIFAVRVLIRDAKERAANRREWEEEQREEEELEAFRKRPTATAEEVFAKSKYFQELLRALQNAGLRATIESQETIAPQYPGDETIHFFKLVFYPEMERAQIWVDGTVSVDMRPMAEIVAEATEWDQKPNVEESIDLKLKAYTGGFSVHDVGEWHVMHSRWDEDYEGLDEAVGQLLPLIQELKNEIRP